MVYCICMNMNMPQCPGLPGRIGNRVKITSGTAAVCISFGGLIKSLG